MVGYFGFFDEELVVGEIFLDVCDVVGVELFFNFFGVEELG